MSRRYDSRTTIFSPEGRLYQVEYAMEAISHAGSCLGILASDGVVLAAEKKVISKLLDSDQTAEKMYKIDSHICCAVAGITSDANILLHYARMTAQRHRLVYQDDDPVEHLVARICDLKHGYTQFGGMRPFGVSILYAGWDRHYQFQLFQSDPSGNYSAWKATAVGANHQPAQSLLKQEWKENLSLKEAVAVAMKVMSKTMDSASLTSEKLEFATLTRNAKEGCMEFHIFQKEEIETLLKERAEAALTEAAASGGTASSSSGRSS